MYNYLGYMVRRNNRYNIALNRRNDKNAINNLLIIGNGFDLSLKMDSSFKDFIGSTKSCNSQFPEYYFNKILYDKVNYFFKLYKDSVDIFSNKLFNILKKYNDKWAMNIFLIPKLFKIHIKSFDAIKHLSDNYFIFKLYLKDYKIDKYSFLYLNSRRALGRSFMGKLMYASDFSNDLQRLDKWGNIQVKKLYNSAKKINLNFWSLLIIFQKKFSNLYLRSYGHTSKKFDNWYDIENMIKEFLISIFNRPIKVGRNKYKYNEINRYLNINMYDNFSRKCFDSYNYINEYLYLLYKCEQYIDKQGKHSSNILYKDIKKKSKGFNILFNNHEDIGIENAYNLYNPLVFLIKACCGYDPIKDLDSMNNNLLRFLHIQLHYFEKDFTEYLLENITSYGRTRYIKRSKCLLNNLNRIPQNNGNCNVLDFNYTPISKYVYNKEHIHGSLNNNDIVIGIGENEINDILHRKNNFGKNFKHDSDIFKQNDLNKYIYNKIYSFTKTYRIITLKHKDSSSMLDNIHNIIIFGHSLGINDYPYFEALFDHVHLYSNSKVKLIFCYSMYDHRKNEKWYKNMQRPKILHMLRLYGKTMSNKDHGRNLISKLLIENRIRLLNVTDLVKQALNVK